MNKYIILYHEPIEAVVHRGSSPREIERYSEVWLNWVRRCGDILVDMGSVLRKPYGGPADENARIFGYAVLKAENTDDTLELVGAAPCPDSTEVVSIEVPGKLPLPRVAQEGN